MFSFQLGRVDAFWPIPVHAMRALDRIDQVPVWK